MREFSLLIKPASADCNLRCDYCFYLDKAKLYSGSTVHRMSDAVLERMIATYFATPQPQYVFGWQGGEPTLLGLDFYRRVTELQLRHAPKNAIIANGLQTNATLIDEAFAEHLGQYKFLVGVSLDGPPEIHDHYRHDIAGRGSHAAVMRGIDRLRKQRVEFNILTLVSQANVHRAREVYRYLRNAGFLYHQYIPCVEFEADGSLAPFAITGAEWGAFLVEIYDEWRAADTRTVSIRHFDSLLELMLNGRANVCTLGRNCCQYFVVEHNGDIYPCDFFVEPRWRLGNVMTTSWTEAMQSPIYREFGAQKTQWHSTCSDCPYIQYCSGDCLKHRLVGATPDPRTLSRLCPGWKLFFHHALPGLKPLVAEIRREQARQSPAMPQPQTSRHPQDPPGRNDPCPCGSGRKFKKCCGV